MRRRERRRRSNMPIFLLKCKKCDYKTEILLHNERAITSFKCMECGVVGLWTRLPTVPLIPKDGTYSWRNK